MSRMKLKSIVHLGGSKEDSIPAVEACGTVPSMTSTTDDDGESVSASPQSAPASTSQQERHYGERQGQPVPNTATKSQAPRYPASLSKPLLFTPMPHAALTSFSPTVSSAKTSTAGLYNRHRRSQSRDLDTARRSLSLTPSPNTKTTRPYSLSPVKKRRRARAMYFLALLFIASMCATLSFTFYLLNQINGDDKSIQKDAPVLSKNANEEPSGYRLDNVAAGGDARDTSNGFLHADKPRIMYWKQDHGFSGNFQTRRLDDDLTLHAPPGQEAVPQDDFDRNNYHDPNCVFQSDWQTSSFPNCNMVHELEVQASGQNVGNNNETVVSYEDSISHLGNGWFRDAWQVDVGAPNEMVVLKTLRLEREFYGEYYELHRRDAVAMERLTFSPFVLNIYGFCGQSAINEMASFGHGGLTSLEKFDRRLRGKETQQAYFVKLQIATSVAVGVAHVHQANGANAIPSIVHYDLNPRNIAIVKGGKPKLNDFNTAEFLRYNPVTNQTCGFPSRLHEPWWRAPEEVVIPKPDELRLVTEKADVYSLGNLLYHILTTHSPRGKMNKHKRIELVRSHVAHGQQPGLHKHYIHSKEPAVIAFKKAMKMCYHRDPAKRASATEVAEVLLEALMAIRKKNPDIGKLDQ